MAKPKTPEGKRVTVCTKFSEAEAEAIDVARGMATRSQWLRSAALAAAERRSPAIHLNPPVHALRQVRAAEQGECPHPKARINKGLCGACGTNVGTTKAGGN